MDSDILQQIQTRINNGMKTNPYILAKNDRKLIREGNLLLMSYNYTIGLPGGNHKPLHFVLCTDLIAYFTIDGEGLLFEGEFPLNTVPIPWVLDFQKEENSFQLIGKNNVITISASNTKEKDEWIEDIEKTINALIESNQYDMKGKPKAQSIYELGSIIIQSAIRGFLVRKTPKKPLKTPPPRRISLLRPRKKSQLTWQHEVINKYAGKKFHYVVQLAREQLEALARLERQSNISFAHCDRDTIQRLLALFEKSEKETDWMEKKVAKKILAEEINKIKESSPIQKPKKPAHKPANAIQVIEAFKRKSQEIKENSISETAEHLKKAPPKPKTSPPQLPMTVQSQLLKKQENQEEKNEKKDLPPPIPSVPPPQINLNDLTVILKQNKESLEVDKSKPPPIPETLPPSLDKLPIQKKSPVQSGNDEKKTEKRNFSSLIKKHAFVLDQIYSELEYFQQTQPKLTYTRKPKPSAESSLVSLGKRRKGIRTIPQFLLEEIEDKKFEDEKYEPVILILKEKSTRKGLIVLKTKKPEKKSPDEIQDLRAKKKYKLERQKMKYLAARRVQNQDKFPKDVNREIQGIGIQSTKSSSLNSMHDEKQTSLNLFSDISDIEEFAKKKPSSPTSTNSPTTPKHEKTLSSFNSFFKFTKKRVSGDESAKQPNSPRATKTPRTPRTPIASNWFKQKK